LGGVEVTGQAFAALGPAVPYVLCIAVFIFAYSTLISWGYYGERAIEYLVGPRGVQPYRVVYVLIVVIGPLLSLGRVLDFADGLLLSMAFPNIIGMLVLSGKVKRMVDDYLARLKSGAVHRVDA
jgi:AGCS family alanine or glycine:cation symporter